MISKADIVCLTCTPELAQSAIAYACSALSHNYTGTSDRAYERLQRAAAAAAVELAFRRYLVDQGIEFETRGAPAFTDPDHYFVSLDGRRCEITSYFIRDRRQIRGIREDPGLLLTAPALLPLEQSVAEGQSLRDLCFFAFVLGRLPADAGASGSMPGPQGDMNLLHIMPAGWAQPRTWIPLGPLILKAEGVNALEVEVGGQDGERHSMVVRRELRPGVREELAVDFHAVTYLQLRVAPRARLGVHSPTRGETVIVAPKDWHSVELWGTEIYLMGWISREQFRQRARPIAEGHRVFQFSRTAMKNLAVDICDLKPIPEFLEKARIGAFSGTGPGSARKKP